MPAAASWRQSQLAVKHYSTTHELISQGSWWIGQQMPMASGNGLEGREVRGEEMHTWHDFLGVDTEIRTHFSP